MRFLTTVVALLSLCIATLALHEADVGVVDWHKHLIGVPLSASVATAPSFHFVGNTSVILTATGNNVFAALDPRNGTVLWRYIFDAEDRIITYHKHDEVVATLSGPGGATLRTFDTLTGQLLLEKRLHAPELGALAEPAHFGKDVIFMPDSIYVLSNGCNITNINRMTGETKWTWSSEDQGSLIIHSKIIVTDDALYAIGMSKSVASYTLHVTSLSPSNGEVIASTNVVSSIVNPLNQFIALTRSDIAKPVALWLEQGTMRHLGLTPTLKEKTRLMKGLGFEQILDVGLNGQGHAVIVRTDGSSFAFKIDGEAGHPKPIWEYEGSAHSAANADSAYAGGTDTLGRPYVGRVFWSHKMEKGSSDIFAGHLVEGEGLASGSYFPFDTKNHGIISHVALDAENPSGWNINSRLLISTSTGSIQLWEQSSLKWIREEALAAIVIAELVEIPEKPASKSSDKGTDGFMSRLMYDIATAQSLPHFVGTTIKKVITNFQSSATTRAGSESSVHSTEGISRDMFGFRQIIVAATVFGKVYGIDSSNGEIVWSRVLGLGWAGQVGGRVQPVKLFGVKTVSDGVDPEVVLVGQRRADNTLVDTVVFHMNAMTGSDITGLSKDDAVFEGHDIIQGPLVEAYLLNGETKVVIMFDEFLQAYLYPDTDNSQATFASAIDSLSFPLRTRVDGHPRVVGHQIDLSQTIHKSVAYPTWSLTLPPGEEIQTLVPQVRGPVASFGKVLGNRTTLYKYLNPRLFIALTASPTRAMCGIYVVDGMKGTVVYHAEIKSTLKGCDIKPLLVENWLVYHYYESEVAGGTVDDTLGYRMVSVEFYEGQKIDDKTESSGLSSFSNDTLNFMTLEKAYVFPYAITALATTSTKFGISSKDLIVATANHRVQSFPRRVLDPRRPNRKITAEEQEEFLTPYDPLLPNDHRRVLSHNYDVANIQRIVTSPALLESTSLVFAYGLDMFLTRVSPSNTFDVLNENFNKVQLVLTVSGLLLAILITRPMVERKKLKAQWYH